MLRSTEKNNFTNENENDLYKVKVMKTFKTIFLALITFTIGNLKKVNSLISSLNFVVIEIM